ncbi:glycerophosphodiester phosphodiesterase [Undibacterium flavidum]|uniref:Glycerophosphodiester phosphodiesterase n=1 Tax=Undibacterium flavidum TaxID=2762297 RepID=A0ABR6Y9E3_9BURK|nr:glycerophosphodiester phosphodiesterase [Undibacterium flavidum]MBC3872799.1 glycerophosphodiester phosphodiesterase [Undibacterium flavidum]
MWPYPKVVAHRGGGSLAPENTLTAMQCGLDYGFRAVEFDVMLSKDGVPVLMHDPDFGRTVAGTGSVATTLAQDLLQMDAGSWFDPRFAQVHVPTYEAVFLFCQAHQIWMNVEIKPAPGFEQETGRVVASLTQKLLVDCGAKAIPPLFSSFSFEALEFAKEAAPEIARGYLIDEFQSDWHDALRTLEAVALHTNQKHLTPEWAKEIKSAGYGLFCYTVNVAERGREILAWGVDGFCTDRIDLISADFAIAR